MASFGMISYSASRTIVGSSFSDRSGIKSPYWRMRGGSLAMKCRSEPRLSRTSVRKASMTAIGSTCQRRHGAGDLAFWQNAGVGHVLLEEILVGGVDIRVVRIDLARRNGRQ